jgi:hypothetical protein
MENTEDERLIDLLNRLRAAGDPVEVATLSAKVERLVFHRQIEPPLSILKSG